MPEDNNQLVKNDEQSCSFTKFMETVPPSQKVKITEAEIGNDDRLVMSDLQLHCPNDNCDGIRYFRCIGGRALYIRAGSKNHYITYECSNCKKYLKVFALKLAINENSLCLYKFGENPPFGVPTPSRMLKLIGPDRELFLKGRQCENQGLGVGAFVYYRRVIEAQKNRIFDQMIEVCKKIDADIAFINELENAKRETQFSKAISRIKNGIPQVLLIGGQNPIQLLYTALSDGLHDGSDEHCMELATSIRVVLAELSDRMSQALKDNNELKGALNKLIAVKQNK